MEEPLYQVAVHTGEDRLYHPEDTYRAAAAYAMRVGAHADFIAVEKWNELADGLRGGWSVVDVVRDRLGYLLCHAPMRSAA